MKYLLLILGLLAACESTPGSNTAQKAMVETDEKTKEVVIDQKTKKTKEETCEACKHEDPTYFYSPFVVRMAGQHQFKSMSFKDVGLKRTEPQPNDPLLEVIAESVALHLSHGPLKIDAEVAYDPTILDPANHVACGSDHLYVDVWRRGNDHFGYSLWSGCGDNDNFAWKEVDASFDPEDPAVAVEPLATSIIDSLSAATKNSCFQKSC